MFCKPGKKRDKNDVKDENLPDFRHVHINVINGWIDDDKHLFKATLVL